MCTYKWTQDWTEQIKVGFQGKGESDLEKRESGREETCSGRWQGIGPG